jgi:hypothetical protein
MDFDPVFLSRLQFAWVIGWHILLPAFTVGLAAYIALVEGLNLVTGRQVYHRVSMFWIKVFSISFGMDVVTGIVMPFQFGTNWSRYSDATANVLSPLFAYEGLTAFFLEAAFLGVLFVRTEAGAAMGPFRCGADGSAGHAVLFVLDTCCQQLDADAGRQRDHRRPLLSDGLAASRLQSVISVAARAHGAARPRGKSRPITAFVMRSERLSSSSRRHRRRDRTGV